MNKTEYVAAVAEASGMTKAQAALVPLGVNIDGYSTIEVERPRLAFMKLLN